MKKVKTNQPKIKLIEGQFCVNPDYVADRTGNYELRDKIAEKWANLDSFIDGNGNCNHQCYFDTEKQTFVFSSNPMYNDDRYIATYRLISPALLLYRLIATFFAAPKCEDNYKMIWHYNLTHKETGKQISFSEWKGAAGFWVSDYEHTKLPTQFKADLIELMNYLVGNECAHPYDNLVAGSVA